MIFRQELRSVEYITDTRRVKLIKAALEVVTGGVVVVEHGSEFILASHASRERVYVDKMDQNKSNTAGVLSVHRMDDMLVIFEQPNPRFHRVVPHDELKFEPYRHYGWREFKVAMDQKLLTYASVPGAVDMYTYIGEDRLRYVKLYIYDRKGKIAEIAEYVADDERTFTRLTSNVREPRLPEQVQFTSDIGSMNPLKPGEYTNKSPELEKVFQLKKVLTAVASKARTKKRRS